MELLISLILITIFFVLFLLLKELLPPRFKNIFCVLCAAVSMTWILFLILSLFSFSLFQNKVLIALLMGQTIVGVYYFIDSRVSEQLKVLRLPFLLTLTTIGYFLLNLSSLSSSFPSFLFPLLFLLVLWLIFLFLLYQQNGQNDRRNRLAALVKKIIDCCRNW